MGHSLVQCQRQCPRRPHWTRCVHVPAFPAHVSVSLLSLLSGIVFANRRNVFFAENLYMVLFVCVHTLFPHRILFTAFMLLAIPILIPLNVINGGTAPGLGIMTMGNVVENWRLWFHLILTILFCGKDPLRPFIATLLTIHLHSKKYSN